MVIRLLFVWLEMDKNQINIGIITNLLEDNLEFNRTTFNIILLIIFWLIIFVLYQKNGNIKL